MPTEMQSLTNQFNELLIEYQETSKKYNDLINKKDNSFIKIPDYSFIGESKLNVLDESNVSACQSVCSENNSCSGATFEKTLNNCTLSKGNGIIVPTSDSTAIVHEIIYYSNKLQELNNQLTYLNEQMNENYYKYLKNKYSKNKYKSQQQEIIMMNNNEILIKERKEIKDMLNQYKTLNAAYEDGNILVNANYINYIVFLFVAIFLLFLLLRFSFSGPQYGGGNGGGNGSMNKDYIIPFAVCLFSVIIIFNVFFTE